jgi:hypothetical protein
MRKLLLILPLLLLCNDALALGGFSSSGGSGGFSSSRSYSAPSRSYTRNTTVTRNYYSSRGYYHPGYGYHPMMYGGFGMGYGYSNGLIEGLIIGSLMHPAGTQVYGGGGYQGQALLYPNGMVVDQNGNQVGMYQNGQFTAVQGGMVAQQAPANAQQYMQQPAPVVVEETSAWTNNIIAACEGILVFIVVVLALIF